MTMLLAATLGLPLLMLAGCLSPALRRVLPSWLWLAPLPGVALALTGTLDKDMALCRIVFRLDTAGALLLAAASVLWALVGAAVPGWLRGRKDAGKFVPCWLATLTGNLGVFLTTDLIGFLIFYALVSLPAYGLIVFEGDPAARKAGNLYLGFAILGENLLLPAFVLLGLGVSPTAPGVLVLVLLGFGMKIALLPLHFWMPPAYTAAPIPAAAVLSGAGVKAGVIGFLRFLPLDAGLSLQDWGLVLAGIGFCGAFYGVGIGLTQKSPKTILAYSSVSQMGFLAALLGVGLSCGEVAIAPCVAFYAAHHALAKGALFLAVGAPRARRWLVLGPATLLGLGLAGLPLTGGALAKLAVKSPLGQGPLAVLASLSAIGTATLMVHFVFRLAVPGRGKSPLPSDKIALPVWLAGVAACLIFPWLFFSEVGLTLDEILSPAALWKTAWPVGLGVMLALGLRRLRIPEIPAGDILAPLAKCAPLPRGIAEILAAINALLRRWPVACASVVLIILALTALASR